MGRIKLIWAQTRTGIIGDGGTMPWHVPEDLAYFSAQTTGHPVLMGRRTWESLPERFRPLSGRENLVLTSDAAYEAPGAQIVTDLDAVLADFADRSDDLWVMGGGQLYRATIDRAAELHVTEIDLGLSGDTSAPEIPQEFDRINVEPDSGWYYSRINSTPYRFTVWQRQDTLKPQRRVG